MALLETEETDQLNTTSCVCVSGTTGGGNGQHFWRRKRLLSSHDLLRVRQRCDWR